MSGIIHINGKDYDLEGNVIAPKEPAIKYVDGIAPLKIKNITKDKGSLKTDKPKKSDLVTKKANTSTFRVALKPPTRSVQRSTTLLRNAVMKPERQETVRGKSLNIISRTSRDLKSSALKHQTHPDIRRVAKSQPHRASTVERQEDRKSETYVPKKKTEEMIQAQLAAANAHLMTFKKPKITHKVKKRLQHTTPAKRRFAYSSMAISATVVIAGLVIYLNLASISLNIASRRAGFSAYLPSYTPNGYRIKNPIGYTKGRIIISFKSNTNDMNYSLEQKPSSWTSETLKDQMVNSNGSQVQMQYVNGLTVYFTTENTATWVDRGVLFTLQGNSGLSSEQIASIAASI